MNIAANKDEQWQTLARHLGREDLLGRAEYLTREHRKTNRLRLKAELETVLTTRPARDWADELNRLGVPSGEALTVPEVLAHPQVSTRGMVARFDNILGLDRNIDVLRAQLFEAALVAGVDHGPQAPSIASARMAVTCGVGLNNAMANGVNLLGDVHGGAGEQAVVLSVALGGSTGPCLGTDRAGRAQQRAHPAGVPLDL